LLMFGEFSKSASLRKPDEWEISALRALPACGKGVSSFASQTCEH
jgi:hypothetical protein